MKEADKEAEMPRLIKMERHEYASINPPTLINTNEFTSVFQEITDTYGVPNYKEINPSIFGCVTFPFLFGVMYGDICHGSFYIIIGSVLCFLEPRLRARAEHDSSIEGVLRIRYILLLMGIFATFCGFMYNDFASVPLYISSCYSYGKNAEGLLEGEPVLADDCVQLVGIDPAWTLSSNEITFMNSVKMKMAVIFGVAHMSMGVCCKGLNAIYNRNKTDFFFEFVPQITMLVALFGYMDLLIIVKWLTDFTGREKEAPAIIGTMINVFLAGGTITEGEVALIGTADYQQSVSLTIVAIVLVCVPLMLIPKPILLSRMYAQEHHRRENHEGEFEGIQMATVQNDDEEIPAINGEVDKGEDNGYRTNSAYANNIESSFAMGPKKLLKYLHEGAESSGSAHHSFGELSIHQLIETIEFVLGTVSNTASYLRLWALSLAHQQLALVFFSNLMRGGLDDGNVMSSTISVSAYFIINTLVVPRLHCVRNRDLWYPHHDGRSGMLPSHAAPALGRVPEQVLQGRRL